MHFLLESIVFLREVNELGFKVLVLLLRFLAFLILLHLLLLFIFKLLVDLALHEVFLHCFVVITWPSYGHRHWLSNKSVLLYLDFVELLLSVDKSMLSFL